MTRREICIICVEEWRSVQGDGSEGDEGFGKEKRRGDIFLEDLLSFLGHHWQGKVLTHVVELVS